MDVSCVKKRIIAVLFVLLLVVSSAFAVKVEAVTEALTTKTRSSFTVDFEDSFFDGPSTEYNHALAQASVGMALSAFRIRYALMEQINPSEHLIRFLGNCGFSDIVTDDYDKTPSLYTVASAIAMKELEDADGEPYTLIAVGVCGGGYAHEWLSNLTVGMDERHKGFDSAANLVENRIFGYIGRHNITGRIKIWIAGFSRAAAIGNIVAADLDDCGVFRIEDIFAYTFATPRTTRDPRDGQYPNIFNIVGQYDVVPQVPLSGWGFERYGTTLYTSLMETDSDFWEKYDRVNMAYREFTGQEFWVNVDANYRLHTLLEYLYDLCPTQEDYVRYLQPKLISIFENRSPNNVIRNFSELAEAGNLINDENRETASELMNFLFLLGIDTLTKTGDIGEMWNPEATATANLVHEHTQDTYMAWVMSSDNPDEVFTDKTEYTRFMFYDMSEDSVVTVTEGDDDNVVYTLNMYSGGLPEKDNCYILVTQTEKSASMTLQNDRDYKVWYQSDADDGTELFAVADFNTMQFAENELFIGAVKEAGKTMIYHVGEGPNEETIVYTFSAGDFGSASGYLPPGFVLGALSTNEKNVSWRALILTGVLVPVLLILLVLNILILIVKFVANRHFSMVPHLFLSLMIEAYLAEELFFLLFRDPTYRALAKLGLGLLSVGLACLGLLKWKKVKLLRSDNGRFFFGMAVCVLVCAIADLVINQHFVAGICVFALVHVGLIIMFVRRRKPSFYQWLTWGIIAVLAVILILLIGKDLGYLRFVAAGYACIISFMVVTSVGMPMPVTTGAVLFMASDLMLGLYHTTGKMLAMHAVFMLLYYLAVFFLAYSCFRHKDLSVAVKEAQAAPVT